MTTDYRAMCAELIEAMTDDSTGCWQREADVLDRARALLAQPEPEEPTDEEVTLTYAYAVAAAVGNKRGPFKPEDAEAAQLAGLRAVLSRWGRPTPEATNE